MLHTDGLVERRGHDLEEGETWLIDTVSAIAGLDLEEVCDRLLTQVRTHTEDDVVLLAVRAHPEDRPRPAEAGPRELPDALPHT